MAVAFLIVVPGTVRAGVDVNVIGELYGINFYADADLDWTSYDCIETKLYFSGILKESEDLGCHSSGYSTWSWLYGSVSGEGTFMFQVWSYWSDSSLYEKSWNVPGISLVTSVSPTNGSIGDTFIPNATLHLTSAGPDYYSSVGTFSFDMDGNSMGVSATPALYSDAYFSYWGEPPHPELYYFTVATTISFGSGGNHNVGFGYTDKLTRFHIDGGSSSILVTDPFTDAIQTLTQRIDSLESRLSSLEANMSEAQGDIAFLKGEVQSIENDISSLQSGLNALSTDYEELEQEFDDLTGRLDELESQIEGVEDDQQTISDSVGTNNILTYLALVLSIVSLVLAVALRRRKKEVPTPPPQASPPQQYPPQQPPG